MSQAVLELDEAGLRIDGTSRVRLTPIERRICLLLLRRSDEIVPASEIVREVWGYEADAGALETLRTHICNLRSKMRRAGLSSGVLRTQSRHGYGMVREAARAVDVPAPRP